MAGNHGAAAARGNHGAGAGAGTDGRGAGGPGAARTNGGRRGDGRGGATSAAGSAGRAAGARDWRGGKQARPRDGGRHKRRVREEPAAGRKRGPAASAGGGRVASRLVCAPSPPPPQTSHTQRIHVAYGTAVFTACVAHDRKPTHLGKTKHPVTNTKSPSRQHLASAKRSNKPVNQPGLPPPPTPHGTAHARRRG